jgi:polysaccharide export outer membrane protein
MRRCGAWRWVLATILALGWAGGVVAAEGEHEAQSPQGPGPAAVPGQAAPDIVGYKPIPSALLPQLEIPATTPVIAPQANLPGTTTLGGPVTTMGPYTLGRDDVIHITVTGQALFSGTYVIGPDGAIQYGYVGDVPVEGLSKEQVAEVLTERLKQFVRAPQVHVEIVGFNSKAIYILGEVSRPGKYAMRGDSIKIRDALIAAGLVTTYAALGKVHVIKAHETDPTVRVMNLKPVLYQGKLKHNIDLVHGDIIVVPSTFMGHVNRFVSAIVNPASRARSIAALATL